MLGIQKVATVAEIVGMTVGDLRLVAEFANDDVTELVVYQVGKKARPVLSVHGKLRQFQEAFFRRRLKARLRPSPYSHGCVSGRSIVSNAKQHLGNSFIFKTDISRFYPSISIDRVNRLFMKGFGCSYEVSRILTRLCTYNYHLALGLVTSPILAEQVFVPIDCRIAELCEKYGAHYSRYVDDLTISAKFNLEGSSIVGQIGNILRSAGLREKAEKRKWGRLDPGSRKCEIDITGIRIKGRQLDVAYEYIQELERQIDDHISLAAGGEFSGPLCTSSQLSGRVQYVEWVNPGRRGSLRRKMNGIDWQRLWSHAKNRNLVAASKVIRRRNEAAPDYSMSFSQAESCDSTSSLEYDFK